MCCRRFESIEERETGIKLLSKLLIDEEPIPFKLAGDRELLIEFVVENGDPKNISIEGIRVGKEAIGLKKVQLDDAAGSNAYHVPEGVLAVYGALCEDPNITEDKELATHEIMAKALSAAGWAP